MITKKDKISQTLFVPVCRTKVIPFVCEELEEITSKPLHYLGNGFEAMAFLSADEKYVLKFFFRREFQTKAKFDPVERIRQLLWTKTSERRNRHIANRYEQALNEIPELTGMVDFHRYTSSQLLPICTVIDPEGKSHLLDLNKLTFAIQKKGLVTDSSFLKANRQHLNPKFEHFFTQITEKGYINIRRSFNPANFALLDDRIIMIDLGELKYAPEKAHTTELSYLQKRYLAHFSN
jgi:hypothetical protein